jgi:hypothetical protein
MTDDAVSSDLADLRKEFEGSGFTFGSVWASAGAGPDARRLFASRGTLLRAFLRVPIMPAGQGDETPALRLLEARRARAGRR